MAVARKYQLWEFEIRKASLGSGKILRSHGDAIEAVALMNEAACPVSFRKSQGRIAISCQQYPGKVLLKEVALIVDTYVLRC
jgi:hypothetical protein